MLEAEILFYDELPNDYPSDHYPVQVTLVESRQQGFSFTRNNELKAASSISTPVQALTKE